MKKYYIHSKSEVETLNIGKNSKIWAFTYVLKGAKIGNNSNICSHCFIENKVVIGNNVTIKFGVHLCNGIIVEDDVFIGPNAAFTNDLYPRSKNINYKEKVTILRKGCSIGANATILTGVEIGNCALIGAGSVVTKNIPAFALAYGNPASIKGYVCVCCNKLETTLNFYTCKCGRKYKITDSKVILINE